MISKIVKSVSGTRGMHIFYCFIMHVILRGCVIKNSNVSATQQENEECRMEQ
jgi:hypothetical protein